ncbi:MULTISPECIES: GbsR/MarR family transcriptional regulator [Paraliobacillus]|uniref:GbsR/MarR family transcriptional regulator n=1 Tax=Paraliobacillus TaxID=200903 RepID=UPI000DD48C06|nr:MULTISPECIES: GbsR/MarR family transcriptional regulator [Paraliobacillus]
MENNHYLETVYNRTIEQVAENMKSYGFPGTIGRVYAFIYFAGEPLDLGTLADKTGMSKTRMSQVLREMVDLNLAEKVFIKGSRKDFYTVDPDYYQNFISLFTSNWKKVVQRNKHSEQKNKLDLKKALQDQTLDAEAKQQAQILIDESEKSQEYFEWIERLVDLFESHDIFNHVPKKDEK